MLWVATIFGLVITSPNVSNLGYYSSHYGYFIAKGEIMWIKSNSRALVVVKCIVPTFILCISMKFEMLKIHNLNQPLIWSDFDIELLEFKLRMNSQMISVLAPFLAFVDFYINVKARNMLSIMLDLNFKTWRSYTIMWAM